MADTVTTVSKETRQANNKKRINYTLAATLLTTGLTFDQIAPKVGAKSGKVLAVGLLRKGVTRKQAAEAQAAFPVGGSLTLRLASQAGEALREDFSNILAKHTAALKQVPAKPNLKHIKAVGEALEPLTRSAKTTFDWGNTDKPSLAMVGLWDEPTPQEPQEKQLDPQSVVVSTPVVASENPLDHKPESGNS